MRIKRLRIQNFRSIRDLEIKPQGLCALVGENSSGKTNILQALDFVLGPRYPQYTSLERTDFYRCQEGNPLRIEIDVEKAGVSYSVVFGPTPVKGGTEFRLQMDGNPYVKGKDRERFPFLLLDTNRELRRQLAYDRWTLLGRLLQKVNEAFRSVPDAEQAFKDQVRRARDVLASRDEFQTLVSTLKEEGAKQLRKHPDDFQVDLEIYDPWNFYRTFQILVTDDNITFQAFEMGMGLQSSLTVAILRAYARLMHDDAILAIEEPEIFLHPQAQRSFYRILREIADGGGQVLYATHSPMLVSVAHFDEICIVRREGLPDQKATGATQVFAASLVEDLKVRHPGTNPTEQSVQERYGHAYGKAGNEGFFASKIVLVEGEAEEYAFQSYLGSVGLDLDREGISVVQAGGKQNLDRLLRLFNEFRIPVYVVLDGDKDKDADGESRRATRELLSLLGIDGQPDYPNTTVGDRYTLFEVDFETTLSAMVLDYTDLDRDAREFFGIKEHKSGKGLRAHYIADRAKDFPEVKAFFEEIKGKIVALQWIGTMLKRHAASL